MTHFLRTAALATWLTVVGGVTALAARDLYHDREFALLATSFGTGLFLGVAFSWLRRRVSERKVR